MCFPQQKDAGRREDVERSGHKPDEKPQTQVILQGAVGYVQLCGLDVVLRDGFVIGVCLAGFRGIILGEGFL